jgi:hypothetical protein
VFAKPPLLSLLYEAGEANGFKFDSHIFHTIQPYFMRYARLIIVVLVVCGVCSVGMVDRNVQRTIAHTAPDKNITINSQEVPYPEGYREWVRVKSAIIGPQNKAFKRFGGIHHIHANPKAMEGYTTGQFPDGSIIVFDLLEAREQQGDVEEGQRRFIDVMVKDSQRFSGTGGWGYEEFKGNSKTERTIKMLATTECFQCHQKQEKQGFVFSKYQP